MGASKGPQAPNARQRPGKAVTLRYFRRSICTVLSAPAVFGEYDRERQEDEEDLMKRFGLFSINSHACATAEAISRVARAAEMAGFESLWAGEHVVLPHPQAPPSPMAPGDPMRDPIVSLTYCAAVTSRVRLRTRIIILPNRNPLVIDKQLASLDVLSGGRLTVGIGVGYLEPEFRALGAPYEKRGAVTDDYLAAMRAIWTQPKPSYEGRFASFSAVQAHPQPAHRPLPAVPGGRAA